MPSDVITICDITRQEESGGFLVSANVQGISGVPNRLWYRTSDHVHVAEGASAFALAGTALGMLASRDVFIEGSVDVGLLENLEEYMKVWTTWMPERFGPSSVRSLHESSSDTSPRGAALLCFSGGVDACTTLYRHTRGSPGRVRHDVRSGLLVHGFDIPLTSPDRFSDTRDTCASILSSVGIPLLTIETNWRDMVPKWRYTHGLALASCLWLMRRKHSVGIIAGGDASYNTLTHGSNPFTDRLLGSDSFPVHHDSGELTRVQKLSVVSEWPEAVQDLRVCFENRTGEGNCGECEKCIRTKVGFAILGVDIPASLPGGLSPAQISALRPPDQLRTRNLRLLLEEAESRGLGTAPWCKALSKKVRQAEYRNGLGGPIYRLFDRISNRVMRTLS